MSSTSVNVPYSQSEPQLPSFTPPVRPRFNSHKTDDRLREGSGRLPSFSMVKNISKNRKSIFRETGLLEGDEPSGTAYTEQRGIGNEHNIGGPTGSRSNTSDREDDTSSRRNSSQRGDDSSLTKSPSEKQSWYSVLSSGRRPRIKAAATTQPNMTGLSRFTMIALLIAVVLPGFGYNNGRKTVELSGAKAGVIRNARHRNGPVLDLRANSPTDVCTRWSHQAAQLNGTLYIYGGQAKTTADQKNNTWNNNFLTLDLTKSWDTKSPALSGLPQPSGPPAVANGYLWNDYNNLFLYGGEFADNPYANPTQISTWRYGIASRTWTEYKDPQTSDGKYSRPGGEYVQRSAEGAGVSVPELGLSWYFGGHLDMATTPGWSNQVARVYLRSLLEFTHLGYVNAAVQALASGTGAGEGGAYRNITQGGIQTDQGFSERADGVLAFVPGWGTSGVLIGLGGGTDTVFSNDFSVLDVYDIANSEWYKQQTKGEAPPVRVNPCAVVASAPDASSFNLYIYGGQNLQPYKQQIQYNDMYILSIPAFTWIKVPDQANPPAARAGHSCHLRDGQMIVVGGYVGADIPCDSPGVHVFNTTSLQWQSSFVALSPAPDLHPDNSVLAGSNGYQVPSPVVSVIGGHAGGAATVTTPAAGVTDGPFATGHPPVYTVTASGSTATVTQWGPGATNVGGAPGGADNSSGGRNQPSGGLVAAGVIAALAGVAAGYLGFCAWLYRRQVRAYRNHLAMANRYPAAASKTSFGGGLAAALFGRKGSKGSTGGKAPRAPAYAEKYAYAGAGAAAAGSHGRYESTSTGESFGWVGRREEPKAAWLGDEPTPGSGTGTTSSGARRYSGSPFGDDQRGGGGGAYNFFAPQGYYHGAGGSGSGPVAPGGFRRVQRRGSDSGGSTSSTEYLIDGQEPSFFSVVLGPRRALRVVNGLEELDEGELGEREREPLE